jgi:dTDP-4-amino-4,6-dideoxygalactose transaminase
VRSERDLTVDPDAVRELLNSRTKAVIATHYAGFAADLARLRAITAESGVALIEDAAHAPVVRAASGMLGTVGDAGCFSCYATKNVTMGEGGVVVCADPERLAVCRAMRSHFMTASARDRDQGAVLDYDVTALGMNYRPTEIAAAIGTVQLGRLSADRERRRAVTARYREVLSRVEGLVLPFRDRDPRVEDSAFHLFVVLLPETADRSAVREALLRRGVPTSVHYPPTHRFSFYARMGPAPDLPMTDRVAGRLLSLPLHARMTESDAEYAATALEAALREVAER